jgi:hypothetical protein
MPYEWAHGRRIEYEVLDTGAKPSKAQWRRDNSLKTSWAQIPHHRGLNLAKRIGDPALAVLLVLEHLIHDAHSNTVKLTNNMFLRYGIYPQAKGRGLHQLATAGVVTVKQKGKSAPIVTHCWYDKDGKLKKG